MVMSEDTYNRRIQELKEKKSKIANILDEFAGDLKAVVEPDAYLKYREAQQKAIDAIIREFVYSPKFKVGDRVKIIQLLDNMTSRELIGKVGIIREIDPLPNGEFNYYVADHYMHEAELKLVERPGTGRHYPGGVNKGGGK